MLYRTFFHDTVTRAAHLGFSCSGGAACPNSCSYCSQAARSLIMRFCIRILASYSRILWSASRHLQALRVSICLRKEEWEPRGVQRSQTVFCSRNTRDRSNLSQQTREKVAVRNDLRSHNHAFEDQPQPY